MKLDRNINPDGKGKYALIKLRENPILAFQNDRALGDVDTTVVLSSAIDYGSMPETDFFVIRIKDKYAGAALAAYANAAMQDDPEYGREIMDIAQKAIDYPKKRMPD